MRKKAILLTFMIIVCAALIYFVKGFEENRIEKQQVNTSSQEQVSKQEQNADIKKEIDSVNDEVKSNTDEVNSSNTTSPANVKPDNNNVSGQQTKAPSTNKDNKQQTKVTPVEVPNLVISDTVSGKNILSKKVSYNGVTAAQATIEALKAAKLSYKTSTFGDSIYFSSINGIKERSAGASSGWCYFINGKKLSVSSGSYKLNKDDKLEWKFLKDGISN
jgi:hypothetical protein